MPSRNRNTQHGEPIVALRRLLVQPRRQPNEVAR